jgi:hypothetical protein
MDPDQLEVWDLSSSSMLVSGTKLGILLDVCEWLDRSFPRQSVAMLSKSNGTKMYRKLRFHDEDFFKIRTLSNCCFEYNDAYSLVLG